MRGYIEVKESSYEDALEYLHKIKSMACKLIKALSEEDEEEEVSYKKGKSRYEY